MLQWILLFVIFEVEEITICESHEFCCNDGQCIERSLRCDRMYNCLDGSDEFACESCQSEEFRCNNGKCIERVRRCDRKYDCQDGSDELDCDVKSLTLLSLDVPELITVGQDAVLNCTFVLEGDTLYSLKWYRDDMEFFRYVPTDKPPNQLYPLPGLNIDNQRSTNGSIRLKDVDKDTGGMFKCEISSDAPSFATVSAEKEMVVEFQQNSEWARSDTSRTRSRIIIFVCILHFFPFYRVIIS